MNQTYWAYWGKAAKPEQHASVGYHLLPYHCLDVAAVGQTLLTSHPTLLRRLSHLMQLPEQQTQTWLVFLLGIHDLGKFAETFQQLRPDLRQGFWPDLPIKRTNYSIRHDTLGDMLWSQYLCSQLFDKKQNEPLLEFASDTMSCWLNPVFGHHGWPPSKHDGIKYHFVEPDQQAALTFVRDWQGLIQPAWDMAIELDSRRAWRQQQKKASWLIAGVAVFADWLGSNQDIFKYCQEPMPLAEYWEKNALPNAARAVVESGVLPKKRQKSQSLQRLFPTITEPTPLQQQCESMTIGSEPQLFILEDVTGAGKTEAALMLAHRLLSAGLGEGLYIGLPTMATANAMYERMSKAYRALYQYDETPSLILSHSARHLSELFQQSLLNDQPANQNYEDEENITAQCNRWFADNRKKALLADVGVGTIDQALLGIVPARHQSLRLLGLLSKVLILDEVHAYDAYTGELLKRLIQFHAALGGSVVLLSATLTRVQRQHLVKAFQRGRDPEAETAELQSDAYPLLTHVQGAQAPGEHPLQTRELVKRQVAVDLYHYEQEVVSVIEQAVVQGKSVCWLRNTVADAREAWSALNGSTRLDQNKLHLFHSRYALGDRIAIEQRMLELFGQNSTPESRRGRVLVATQVVEQSLDLDFDLMISDLAPIDLLIQRAGRLQRHARDPQGRLLPRGEKDQRGIPRLAVLAPQFSEDPKPDWYKATFPKAHYVYQDTLLLWRSVKILRQTGGWHMPEDARSLLEFVYDTEGEIPVGLEDSNLAADGSNRAMRDNAQFLQMQLGSGYVTGPQWDEDVQIATRLGEETQPLYLARWQDGELSPWINEGKYPWDLSSVQVNKNQIAKLGELDNPALAKKLGKLRDQTKLFNEYSLILPIIEIDGVWQARAVTDQGKVVTVHYSTERGLEMLFE